MIRRRARELATEAVIGVQVGALLVILACGGFHAWLKGRAQ